MHRADEVLGNFRRQQTGRDCRRQTAWKLGACREVRHRLREFRSSRQAQNPHRRHCQIRALSGNRWLIRCGCGEFRML
jgi:hypothetical protein